MDTAVIAAICTVFGIIIKAVIDGGVAFYKQRTDTKTGQANVDSAVRDDLLALVDKYEAREARLLATIDKKDAQIETLQESIAKLLDENTTLRQEKRQFQYESIEKEREVIKLKKELEAFERKVYYVRQITDDLSKQE